MKIAGKAYMTQKTLWVHTASQTTVGPRGIVPLIMNIKEQFQAKFHLMYETKTAFDNRTHFFPKSIN